MSPYLKYALQRLVQYVVVIFTGLTIIFIIPRLTPVDPVEIAISRAAMIGQYQNPEAVIKMREALSELYGLKGSLMTQYLQFWGRLFTGDFGPSLSNFPTKVMKLIMQSLPWTALLLFVSAILGWLLGNLMGALAEYYREKRWSKALGIIAMGIFPIPYYIVALGFTLLFSYGLGAFPISGGFSYGSHPNLSLGFFIDVLYHAFLPGLSLVVVSLGSWFLTMKSLVSRSLGEDYVVYARTAGISKRRILFKYIIPNTLLPQVTGLALTMGGIFSGALITEYVFSYPGLGQLLYSAVTLGDFSLMMGIVALSVVGISTAVLIVDLSYPLFDPRIRYK